MMSERELFEKGMKKCVIPKRLPYRGKNTLILYLILALLLSSIAQPAQAHTRILSAENKQVLMLASGVDADGDWVADEDEVKYGSDPTVVDTDEDGFSDFEEIFILQSDPTQVDVDTDGDGFFDGVELRLLKTDPAKIDVDQDGDLLPDAVELAQGLELDNPDTDGDLLSDFVEMFFLESDPLMPDNDTNGNGYPDILEERLSVQLQNTACQVPISLSINALTIHDPEEADTSSITGGDEAALLYLLVVSSDGKFNGLSVDGEPDESGYMAIAEQWAGNAEQGDSFENFVPVGPATAGCGLYITAMIAAYEDDSPFGPQTTLGGHKVHHSLLLDRLPLGWHIAHEGAEHFIGSSHDGTYDYEVEYRLSVNIPSSGLASGYGTSQGGVESAATQLSAEADTSSATETKDVTSPNDPRTQHEASPELHQEADQTKIASIHSLEPTLNMEFGPEESRWGEWENEASQGERSGGAYHITLNKANNIAWNSGNIVASDFFLEFMASPKTAASGGAYGTLFRYVDEENFYQFALTVDGEYSLSKLVEDKWHTIIPFTASSAIHTGANVANRIGVLAAGSAITLYINDIEVATAQDEEFPIGDIALSVGTHSEPTTIVTFDKLQYWNLNTLAGRLILSQQTVEELSVEELLQWADEFYWNSEMPHDALTLYNRILEIDDTSVAALTGRGNSQRVLDSYELAVDDFNRAIELNKQYAPAYRGRGLALASMGKPLDAFDDLSMAITLNPDYALAYASRGDLYSKQGSTADAMRDFDMAIRLEPSNGALYEYRGNHHYAHENYFGSLVDYNQAIQFNPLRHNLYNGRGIAYNAQEKYVDALIEFNKALSLNPNDFWSINNRSLVHGMLELWEAALRDVTNAIEIEPNHGNLFAFRGWLHQNIEDYRAAIEDYDEAIELGYADPAMYHDRAVVLDELGNDQEALHAYQLYLEMDPDDNEWTRHACDRVNTLSILAADSMFSSFFNAAVTPCNRFPSGPSYLPESSENVVCRTHMKRDSTDGPLYPVCECSDGTVSDFTCPYR